MKISVLSQSGEKKEELTLSKAFDVKVKKEAITLYINYLRNALRAPIANVKDRGAVSGGGKKPWRQKGTGNARVGSSRSPLWVGGGVTFGPSSDQNFRTRINSAEKKRVILGIIASFFQNKKAIIVENLALNEPKTKEADKVLNNIGVEGKVSVVISGEDKNSTLAFRNISGIKIMPSSRLDMLHIFSSNQIVMSKKALEEMEATYTGNPTKKQ
jgi:large subunit ribosomal protein L4